MMEEEPKPLKEMTPQEIFIILPNLTPENHTITSEFDPRYNCVAWITGIKNKFIHFYYDDEGEVADDISSNKYVEYYQSFGFIECEDAILEEGIEKIAFYENMRGEFLHVSLQLESGEWTSKLGKLEDIRHTDLEALQGKGRDRYGFPVRYMKRDRNR